MKHAAETERTKVGFKIKKHRINSIEHLGCNINGNITDRNLKLRFEKCSTEKAYGRERILYSNNNTLIPLSSTDRLIEASNSKNTEKLLQIIKAKDEYIKKILVRNRELENKVSRLTMKVTMLNSTKCKSETNSEIRKSLCNKNFKILASKNIIQIGRAHV